MFLLASVTGWVNRFANAGDTAAEIVGNTAFRVRLSCSSSGYSTSKPHTHAFIKWNFYCNTLLNLPKTTTAIIV